MQDRNFTYVIGLNSSFPIHLLVIHVVPPPAWWGPRSHCRHQPGVVTSLLAPLLPPTLPTCRELSELLALPGLCFNQSWPECLTLRLNRIEINAKDKQLATVASGLAP